VRRWALSAKALAVTLALAGALGCRTATAEGPRTYTIDPARSQLRFEATSRFMNATGYFKRFGGEIRVDPAQPEAASGRLTIEVASLDTRNSLRDDHLRSADFFDVERHPTATFVTGPIRREGDRLVVEGQLTIRGAAQPATAPVALALTGDGIRVSGELAVSRRAFGVAYQSVINPIRDEVRVVFELVAVGR